MLAVLAFTPTDVNFSGNFGVSLSNFVFADQDALPLNTCDMDFNPLNGCDVSTAFDFSIDCAGDWFGDAQVLTYCYDTDGDGLGDVGSETDFCDAFVEDGWGSDCSDDCPLDAENDADDDDICGDVDDCQYDAEKDADADEV